MIGLIVDGEGDYAAFRARYAGSVRVLKADGPRGHAVDEELIVSSARKQIQILKQFGCSKIAVVTDFESRAGAVSAFVERLKKFALRTSYAEEVIFVAPDRMIENWFLADIVEASKKKIYLKKMTRQRCYESKNGKQEIKKMFVHGHDYSEVKHSAELFPLVRGGEAAKFSPSFAEFRKVTGLD